MPLQKIKALLADRGIDYDIIRHSRAFTSQKAAAAAHVPGWSFAKTVIADVEGQITMLVLPAACRVDFDKVREALGTQEVKLCSEREFRDLFPESELGAMPPLGNLYDIPVWVDSTLTDREKIAFMAGSHSELVRIPYADFEAIVQPHVASFARSRKSQQSS
ncbi:YbaK/EbsC family protein [Pontibacter sp. G13]|uniref:aminoacyl-tRNA deacylase n=1 Tax=Pontibacter sp. G13 TaxID=3074898 RepID=UPI00288995E0|nr:YbaK/EbsC family protein [Pontibacter sp. G13]WNJ18652.1 YbaK/EbsC family protein [Pontibacter sp. G13]